MADKFSIGERVGIDFSRTDFEAITEEAIILSSRFEKLLDVKKADGSDLFAFFYKVKLHLNGDEKEIREDRIIKYKVLA